MRLTQQSQLGGGRASSGWCACPVLGDGNQISHVNTFCGGFGSCTECCARKRPLAKPQERNFAGGGFRKQSGDSGGKILGLTTQQALIAVGVGVAAYFIIKKVK